MKILRPYQKDIFRWAVKIPSIGLCPVDMRLGKSLISIRLAKVWGCQRILIVAPYSITVPLAVEWKMSTLLWSQLKEVKV